MPCRGLLRTALPTTKSCGSPPKSAPTWCAHLTTPVRYADLIRKLAAQAPTVFVEVGPQQALSRLNRRILPPHELAGIACDNPARGGVEQLIRVQALLECTGALDQARATAGRRIGTRGAGDSNARCCPADVALRRHGASPRKDASSGRQAAEQSAGGPHTTRTACCGGRPRAGGCSSARSHAARGSAVTCADPVGSQRRDSRPICFGPSSRARACPGCSSAVTRSVAVACPGRNAIGDDFGSRGESGRVGKVSD